MHCDVTNNFCYFLQAGRNFFFFFASWVHGAQHGRASEYKGCLDETLQFGNYLGKNVATRVEK